MRSSPHPCAASFAFVVGMLGLLSGCHLGGPPAQSGSGLQAAAPPRARDASECARCNGLWGQHGLATEARCNCQTTDGWRPCRDGFDCQGACVVSEAPESEVVEQGPPARGYYVGHCSDHVTPQGCVMLIEKGARQAGPVSLEEPPQRLCVD